MNSVKYGINIAYKRSYKNSLINNGFKFLNSVQNYSKLNNNGLNKNLLRTNSTFKNSFAFSTNRIYMSDDEKNEATHKMSKYFLAVFGLIGLGFYNVKNSKIYCKEKEQEEPEDDPEKNAGKFIEGLPLYTEEEILKHNKDAKTIWVSFRNGVYDITEFVDGHPGGKKILLAAGTSIEPFWEIYAVHKKPEVYELLEELRIGNLKVDPNNKPKSTDAYQNEPHRHSLLKVLTAKPFNAEVPREFSADNLITPNDLFFVRNHMPVPKIDPSNFKLEIVNELTGKTVNLNLDDIQNKFKLHTIPVSIQCSGNRRKHMHDVEPVQGLMWDVGGISTAEWTGIKLKDLLVHYGFDLDDERLNHIHFEGLDKDLSGVGYAASIPIDKVKNDIGDVLVAFKMNGETLPADHGYPLRIVVPGIIAARSVKWLGKVILSDKESQSHWQTSDYKMLSPSIKNLKDADFSKYKSIQEMPIQSAICEPVDGKVIKKKNKKFRVKGYAFSGGGNDIECVKISIDNGKNWNYANLKKFDRPLYRSWAWTLWEIELDIPQNENKIEIICVATDSNQNTQPESIQSIWNARGLLSNQWHRVVVNLE